MRIKLSRLTAGLLAVAAIALMSGRCWAIYNGLGPSQDEYGMKYDVAVSDAGGNKATVVFTLADEGRLKPFHSVELIALSKEVDNQGGHSYDVKTPFMFKATSDGKRVAQVQIPKNVLDRAKIRILTLNFDGQRSTYAWNYDIPVAKYLDNAPSAPLPVASPPSLKVIK